MIDTHHRLFGIFIGDMRGLGEECDYEALLKNRSRLDMATSLKIAYPS